MKVSSTRVAARHDGPLVKAIPYAARRQHAPRETGDARAQDRILAILAKAKGLARAVSLVANGDAIGAARLVDAAARTFVTLVLLLPTPLVAWADRLHQEQQQHAEHHPDMLLTSVAFLRASLERERSSFERLWLWFLVPAGIAELSLIAGVLATGGPRAGVAALAAGIVAFFGFIFLRSRLQARRLRTEIEALPRTDGGVPS